MFCDYSSRTGLCFVTVSGSCSMTIFPYRVMLSDYFSLCYISSEYNIRYALLPQLVHTNTIIVYSTFILPISSCSVILCFSKKQASHSISPVSTTYFIRTYDSWMSQSQKQALYKGSGPYITVVCGRKLKRLNHLCCAFNLKWKIGLYRTWNKRTRKTADKNWCHYECTIKALRK